MAASAGCLLLACAGGAWPADLLPQRLTVKPAIDAGANVFTIDQQWSGASSVHVFGAENLGYKGSLTSGTMAQMLISADGKTAYTASVYMKRISYGDAEMVLQSFDVATLSLKSEIPLPPKLAMLTDSPHMLAESADGRYVYVQNATPATSVTVVDVIAGKATGEIPTPGCFGIYPSVQGHKFSVICGDGTFASYLLTAEGSSAERTQSSKIFDVDSDPIFQAAQRVGGDLICISFHGNIYRLSDAGAVVQLLERLSMTQGISGNWAPGGYEVMAYNKSHEMLFVGMHSKAQEGSQRHGAQEVWAYDLRARKIVHRSPVEGILSLTVSDEPRPVLFGLKSKAIVRFEVDTRENVFALKQTHEKSNPGSYNLMVVLRP